MDTPKKQAAKIAIAVLAFALLSPCAFPWGEKAQLSVVTTAIHVLSRGGTIPLTRLQNDVRDGANITSKELERMLPSFSVDPLGVIEGQMYLLQSVKGKRVDAYYAFRLGVLGKLVAIATSPLRDAEKRYRDRYNADADRHIMKATMTLGKRKIVDPKAYFAFVRREAARSEIDIIQDYRDGVGFSGVARAKLSADASRSVNAVADVWYSILRGNVIVANVSETETQSFVLGALRFYINRGNEAETEAAYDRIMGLAKNTSGLRQEIGDMFYVAGAYERAMTEYAIAVALDPSLRSVVEKMANFYTQRGDSARKEGRLEDARDAYAKAKDTDSMHPQAPPKLFQVESMIDDRDKRLESAEATIEQARALEAKAEQEIFANRHAKAISVLREASGLYGQVVAKVDEAEALYRNVPEEFHVQRTIARQGAHDINYKIREFTAALVSNSERLSGTGFSEDAARELTLSAAPLGKEALRKMVERELANQMNKLNQDLRNTIK